MGSKSPYFAQKQVYQDWNIRNQNKFILKDSKIRPFNQQSLHSAKLKKPKKDKNSKKKNKEINKNKGQKQD